MERRREVLGDNYVLSTLAEHQEAGTTALQTYITEVCWGNLWSRPQLQDRDRSLLCLAMMVALGREFELKRHIIGARRNGLSWEDIFEAILFTVPYCGIPATLDATKVFLECRRESDLKEKIIVT